MAGNPPWVGGIAQRDTSVGLLERLLGSAEINGATEKNLQLLNAKPETRKFLMWLLNQYNMKGTLPNEITSQVGKVKKNEEKIEIALETAEAELTKRNPLQIISNIRPQLLPSNSPALISIKDTSNARKSYT